MSTFSDLRNLVSRLHAFSWEAFTTRTGGIGARGVGEHEGQKPKYGEAARKALASIKKTMDRLVSSNPSASTLLEIGSKLGVDTVGSREALINKIARGLRNHSRGGRSERNRTNVKD